jgi:hypothetical protein
MGKKGKGLHAGRKDQQTCPYGYFVHLMAFFSFALLFFLFVQLLQYAVPSSFPIGIFPIACFIRRSDAWTLDSEDTHARNTSVSPSMHSCGCGGICFFWMQEASETYCRNVCVA